MSKIYIALELLNVIDTLPPMKIKLPEGCVGAMYAFKYKKDARKFCGRDVELQKATILTKKRKGKK